MPDSLTIKLSYTVCSCTPWPVSLRDTARFTMREPKTPEELRAEKDAIKRAGGTGKPKPYKFTSHSCVESRNGSGYFLIGFWPHLKLELEKRNIPYSIDDQRDQTLRPDPDYSCLSGQRVPHVFHMLTGTHRLPWRVSAIEQESELLGHLNG